MTGPVLNDYGFGGYLIFEGIPPFIDGRAELYGDEFIKRYVQAMLLDSDELPKLLDRNGIACAPMPIGSTIATSTRCAHSSQTMSGSTSSAERAAPAARMYRIISRAIAKHPIAASRWVWPKEDWCFWRRIRR